MTGPTTYAEAHLVYRAAGWPGPLPLPIGKKWPPPEGWTGHQAPYPSGADSHAWTEETYPGTNRLVYGDTSQLALRMARDTIGLDVDHYGKKHGADTIAEAERRWGPLPPAPRSSARGAASPSGIRFYGVPEGTVLRGQLAFRDVGLGDVEIIQAGHRYAVVWPSTNPDAGGAPYQWIDTAGPDRPPRADRLHPLPELWLENLRSVNDKTGEVAADPQAVAEFARAHTAGSSLSGLTGVLGVWQRDALDSSRHDAMLNATCMAAREVRAGHYPAGAAVSQLRAAWLEALAKPRPGQRSVSPAEARREFDALWSWAVAQALTLTPSEALERTGVRQAGVVQGAKIGGPMPTTPAPAPSSPPPASSSPVVKGAKIGGPSTSALSTGAGPATASDPAPWAGPPSVATGATINAAVSERHLRPVGDDEELPPAPAELDAESGWRPVDLGPYLTGTVERAHPGIGMMRRDGVQLFYPGKEHAVIGEMEAGKSWAVLASVVEQLAKGATVVYFHFEEDDPADTVERLLLLGAQPADIETCFLFCAPPYAITPDVVAYYVEQQPTIVVLDGQNEAMSLHGMGIREEDGAAAFRRTLVKPFTAAGAAVIACDHVVKDSEKSAKGYALGSIHKGNGINGTIVLLENAEPFGIGRRGASRVYVTKDRPGQVRQHGQPTSVPRKFFLGMLVVDSTEAELELSFWPPAEDGAEAVLVDAASAWDNPSQAQVPPDVAAYRGAGQGALLDLCRFVRHHGQGGLGVDLSGAKAAMLALTRNGRTKHTRNTVDRAWGVLWDLDRIAPAEANTSENRRGLMWWVPKPNDPQPPEL